ncbi:MBL fold metallo-hydrolase [Methanogenium organophilum]|uniref:MBL fold metallo-hydrolase n=1 Tax=Methanogenium organophilum TaxID=2199 RepID=A0A9X9T9Q3_METOG|nr:MBL fold metallo-hydrolase [Methanogenium organophilum]WAI02322.1 MBL fold metallo-hydrolase [Methanogenium organophilum]
MKISNLTEGITTYTSNVYLVTGVWNALKDKNTLIDVGRAPSIVDRINHASTGLGKHKVDQVILTHSHYDHTSLLPRIREVYKPEVYAFSKYLKDVDTVVRDGDLLRIGDETAEIIHTPGHSSDSICIYCRESHALFSGDTPLIIRSDDGTYDEQFVLALERICRKDISAIYPGHGDPLRHNCQEILQKSLDNVHSAIQRHH